MHRKLVLLAATAACSLAVAAPSAPAVVPPKNCGTITVKGKRYNVKADQLRCSTAVRYTRRYIATRRRPSGYRCTRYKPSETKLAFRCVRAKRNFFAIRR